VLFDHF
jgi:hypothetical protein